MSIKYSSKILQVALILSIVFLGVVTLGTNLSEGQAKNEISAMAPAVFITVRDVPNVSLPTVFSAYSKIADIGIIEVQSADSLLELTYNGRIAASDSSTSTEFAIFEIRLDEDPSTLGIARATLSRYEWGQGGVPVSFTGIFSGYSAGEHTVSVWVRADSGYVSNPTLNPGILGTDVVIAKEYTPFGYTYLPLTLK